MEKKRIEWIDLLRAFAILAVLLCHATEGIYQLKLESVSAMPMTSKIIAFGGFSLGRIGVPIFLMISGYLLLDRTYERDTIIKFWKNNWFKLLICTEIWFLIYELFLKYIIKQDVPVQIIIKDMLFIHKINMGHVWYMPMILGMYVLIPFVAIVLKNIDMNMIKYTVAFFSIWAFVFPLIKVMNDIFSGEDLSLQMSLGYSGGAYGLYLVLGYMLKKGLLKNLKTPIAIGCCLVAWGGTVAFQIWAYSRGCRYNVWYDFPLILIASTLLFELGSRIKKVRFYSVVKQISYYSFAIYLIHFMIRMLLINYFSNIEMMRSAKVMLVWIVDLVASLVLAWLINKVPKIGKFILYTK